MTVLLLALLSSDPGTLFLQANGAYEAGRYDEAVRLYEELAKSGADSGHVWYNLGNAYLRVGALGEAVAAYRSAQALLPRDEDVRANLAFARQSAQDAVQPPEPAPLVATLFFWHFQASRRELLIILVLVNALFWSALALRLRRGDSETLRWAAVTSGVLAAAVALSLGLRLLAPERLAVMRGDAVAVRAGIGDDAVVRFVLHAGTEARWLEERDGWLRIALSDGKQGWVNSTDVLALRL